jgi:hypothetical protein
MVRGMKKYSIFYIFVMLVMTACEKEIDLDYRSVDAIYVAEGCMTQEKTTVRLTTTQDMTDNQTNAHNVEGAVVVISDEDMVLDTLRYAGRGLYTSNCKGIYSFTYTLDIYVNGRHFSSTSTMQQAPQVNSFRFVWKKVLTERMLFAELKLHDIPGENNFYFMHLYRNGIGYRWAVMNDANNPGEELQQLFNCTTERELDKNKADALHDGDRIQLEIRSIDRRTYDYFYSMQVMDNMGSNPVVNFSGGCLGYFSAFHVQTLNYVFKRDEIEEED